MKDATLLLAMGIQSLTDQYQIVASESFNQTFKELGGKKLSPFRDKWCCYHYGNQSPLSCMTLRIVPDYPMKPIATVLDHSFCLYLSRNGQAQQKGAPKWYNRA